MALEVGGGEIGEETGGGSPIREGSEVASAAATGIGVARRRWLGSLAAALWGESNGIMGNMWWGGSGGGRDETR